MSNKETLQSYNTRLGDNNVTLDSILDTINNLPEASTNGTSVAKGFVYEDFDSEGYPTTLSIIGMETIPSNYFNTSNKNVGSDATHTKQVNLLKFDDTAKLIDSYAFQYQHISTIKLGSNITSIGQSAFSGNKTLTEIDLSNVTNLGLGAFEGCAALKTVSFSNEPVTLGTGVFSGCALLEIKKLPDSITTITRACFAYCYGLTQLSMNNVTSITGGRSTYSGFGDCSGLKAVWIGSAITKMDAYPFYNCTSLSKIFIDLPRVTVESFTGYSSAFSSNAVTTDVIVCNDDEDFMTREEFDAIDWSIYEV